MLIWGAWAYMAYRMLCECRALFSIPSAGNLWRLARALRRSALARAPELRGRLLLAPYGGARRADRPAGDVGGSPGAAGARRCFCACARAVSLVFLRIVCRLVMRGVLSESSFPEARRGLFSRWRLKHCPPLHSSIGCPRVVKGRRVVRPLRSGVHLLPSRSNLFA